MDEDLKRLSIVNQLGFFLTPWRCSCIDNTEKDQCHCGYTFDYAGDKTICEVFN